MRRLTLVVSMMAILGIGLATAAQQKTAKTSATTVVVYKSPT